MRVVRNLAEDADEAAHHRRMAARQPGDVWVLYQEEPYMPSLHYLMLVLNLRIHVLHVHEW